VFLGRYPDEPIDDALAQFYPALFEALGDSTFRHGRWQLCDRSGWPDNQSFQNLVAWSWDGASRWLIIVNLSDQQATARVTVPWPELAAQSWQLIDPMQDITFQRSGDDLAAGLFVALDAWHWHLFRVEPSAPTAGPS
jgi:hypothetical protein